MILISAIWYNVHNYGLVTTVWGGELRLLVVRSICQRSLIVGSLISLPGNRIEATAMSTIVDICPVQVNWLP